MLTLDYSVDPALVDDAAAADVAELALVPTSAYVHGRDDVEELGAPDPDAPRTPAEAIAEGRRLSVESVYVGVGYCLKVIRGLYGVAALYPDAETGWEEATQRHRTGNPLEVPRGVPVWWTNGGFGHVALSVGGGYCLTTDYRRAGHIDVAPIAPLAAWCGGRLVGWSETINGVDVWDRTPRPAPPTFDLDDRIRLVRNALRRARDNNAPIHRRDGLAAWLERLERRAAERNTP